MRKTKCDIPKRKERKRESDLEPRGESCPRKRSSTEESAKRWAVVGARNGDLARNRNREPLFQLYNGVRRNLEFKREPVELENWYFEYIANREETWLSGVGAERSGDRSREPVVQIYNKSRRMVQKSEGRT